jgi:hypothetical protein
MALNRIRGSKENAQSMASLWKGRTENIPLSFGFRNKLFNQVIPGIHLRVYADSLIEAKLRISAEVYAAEIGVRIPSSPP